MQIRVIGCSQINELIEGFSGGPFHVRVALYSGALSPAYV